MKKNEYQEQDYLMISGIQHYIFCRRQWSLIHIENQWADNVLTVEGEIIHEHCHDEGFTEKRKSLLVTRGMRIHSAKMGATGQCDVVEFHQSNDGAVLYGRNGYWIPVPIEYKHGKEKYDLSDQAQLCAQAMCLEDMLCCDIEYGFLYYNAVHRREKIEFTNDLREFVKHTFSEMHKYLDAGKSVKTNYTAKCKKCSLSDICLPQILSSKSVKNYYTKYLGE